jgi:large subunit ribosomal protein L31e
MIDEAKKEIEISEDAAEEELAKLAEAPQVTETPQETTPAEAPAKPAEEAKPRKKKEEAEDIVEEKTYTIPLGKALIMPPRKRAPRAMHMIRAYIVKHMKIPSRAEEEDENPPTISITNELNERVWGRGIEKPPRKIRVRATKDKEGNVTVHLAEGE